jgi:hypothetical protein
MVDQLIPWRRALRDYLGTSPTTAWRLEQVDPEFAALKVQLGPNRHGARLSALQRYIASRPPAERVVSQAQIAKAVAGQHAARAKRKATAADAVPPEAPGKKRKPATSARKATP